MVEFFNKKTDKKVLFWINRQIKDPVTKIMLNNTNLTEIQLNTLLLDFLSEGFSEEKFSFEQKAKLRRIKADIKDAGEDKKRKIIKTSNGVSRGAFNRVLKQARKNVIKSIYTVILLGYLGLFESPRLQQYLDLSDEIREYAKNYEKAYDIVQNEGEDEKFIKEYLKNLQKYLNEMIERLGNPLSIKENKEK